MIKRIILLNTAFLFICNIAFGSQVDSLMNVLDQEIIQSKKYQEAREMRIESLKKLYESSASIPDQSYLIISKLYEEYRAYNFDSALYYIDLKILFQLCACTSNNNNKR